MKFLRLKTGQVLNIEKVPLRALYTSTVSRNVILAVCNERDSTLLLQFTVSTGRKYITQLILVWRIDSYGYVREGDIPTIVGFNGKSDAKGREATFGQLCIVYLIPPYVLTALILQLKHREDLGRLYTADRK